MELIEGLLVDPVSTLADGVHPMALMAHEIDANAPMYHEAMHSADHDGYHAAMKTEIKQLEQYNMWNVCDQMSLPSNTNILPSTWAYKQK